MFWLEVSVQQACARERPNGRSETIQYNDIDSTIPPYRPYTHSRIKLYGTIQKNFTAKRQTHYTTLKIFPLQLCAEIQVRNSLASWVTPLCRYWVCPKRGGDVPNCSRQTLQGDKQEVQKSFWKTGRDYSAENVLWSLLEHVAEYNQRPLHSLPSHTRLKHWLPHPLFAGR